VIIPIKKLLRTIPKSTYERSSHQTSYLKLI
jgi:hypothetical protein